MVNSQAIILRISVGDCDWNHYIESLEILKWYTIAEWE
jgi:hypothetical protein